nr:DNA-directed RNA polymerase [Burkholderia cepacia]
MTTPYGVSERGILTQLIQDGFADHIENGKERYAAADYLTQKIVGALDESIEAPRRAMDYFRSVAVFLEERGLPLVWDPDRSNPLRGRDDPVVEPAPAIERLGEHEGVLEVPRGLLEALGPHVATGSGGRPDAHGHLDGNHA